MARKVFFSFHFQRDHWRVSQVRNSNVVQSKYAKNTFLDAADWEAIKRQGDQAIKNWISQNMTGTSVTIVLIGAETANRKWVIHEIQESYKKGNGMLGIYIHNLKDRNGYSDVRGQNPFDNLYVPDEYGRQIPISRFYRTYDWNFDNGYQNIETWIEEAARNAGR